MFYKAICWFVKLTLSFNCKLIILQLPSLYLLISFIWYQKKSLLLTKQTFNEMFIV